MSTLKIRAVRVLRKVAGTNPYAAKKLKALYSKPKVQSGENFTQMTGRQYTIVRSKQGADERRVGIYLRGACDLPALFRIAPLMRDTFRGTCAIKRDPNEISGSRSDLMMQTLHDLANVPQETLDEVTAAFKLGVRYFSSDIFDPAFTIEGQQREMTFDKNVIVLSAAADFSRTLYRHREHGLLVDPGGFWLNSSIDSALHDMDAVKWFNKNFKSIGKMTPEDYHREFGAFVTEVKKRTGAHVMVLNLLAVDPADLTHNYRLIKNPDNARRRAFNVALAEMSEQHDFDIVDVDRILKGGGISGQVDFAHASEEQFMPVAAEAYRILKEREIL